MAMTTKKPPVRRKLVRRPVGAVDKRRRKRGLTPAIKTALDAIIFEKCTRDVACKRAGISERALYLALEKPEVLTYYNRALEVLRSGERPRNIHRLAEIREAAPNMPAVQAIRTLEGMGHDAPGRPGGTTQTLPGLVVVIRAGLGIQPQQPPRDITPPRPIVEHQPAEPIFTPNGSKAR